MKNKTNKKNEIQQLKKYQQHYRVMRVNLAGIEEDIDNGFVIAADKRHAEEVLEAIKTLKGFLRYGEAEMEAQIDDFENEEN